jgi:hypothetical protein
MQIVILNNRLIVVLVKKAVIEMLVDQGDSVVTKICNVILG